DGSHRTRELLAQRRLDTLARIARTEACNDSPVVAKAERDVGTRQRGAREHLLAVAELGGLALEELPPRGGVVVEIVDLDRRAVGLSCRLDCPDASALGVDGEGPVGAGRAACDADTRDRSDAREGFAPESEGSNLLEIVERGDLACRVPRERHRQ